MSETKLESAKIVNAALPSMPFWKSKIFVGAVAVVLATIAQIAGLVSPVTVESINAHQSDIADIVVALFQGGGGMMAAWSRLTQKAAPPIGVTP